MRDKAPAPPTRQAIWLEDNYDLTVGTAVEVELLVVDDTRRPRTLAGTIRAALPAVLVLEVPGGITSRIRWDAIAVVRTAAPRPTHPALGGTE